MYFRYYGCLWPHCVYEIIMLITFYLTFCSFFLCRFGLALVSLLMILWCACKKLMVTNTQWWFCYLLVLCWVCIQYLLWKLLFCGCFIYLFCLTWKPIHHVYIMCMCYNFVFLDPVSMVVDEKNSSYRAIIFVIENMGSTTISMYFFS